MAVSTDAFDLRPRSRRLMVVLLHHPVARATAKPRPVRRNYVPWPASLHYLGAALLCAGMLLGFALTSIGAASTGELSLDHEIARHRSTALIDLARIIDVGIGPALAATLLALACIAIWGLHSMRLAVVFGALTCVGWCASLIGKAIIARHRPPSSLHPLVIELGRDSFPSGHTSFAAAVVAAAAASLWLTGRSIRPAFLIGLPLVAIVAFSRLELSAHYLGDVLAAPLFAFGAVALVAGFWRTGVVPGLSRAEHHRG